MSRLTDEQLVRITYAAMANTGTAPDETDDDVLAEIKQGGVEALSILAGLRAVADAAVAAYKDHETRKLIVSGEEDNQPEVTLNVDWQASAYVPEGYALVPIEPTSVMVDAGYDAYGKGHFTPAIIDCYRAMVLTSQKEPA